MTRAEWVSSASSLYSMNERQAGVRKKTLLKKIEKYY
jgi:hypothetical protein